MVTCNIISKLSKSHEKIFIVAKETFVLEQWKETLNQFLPNATVGKLVNGKSDNINANIILCSIKDSLSTNLFSENDIIIIDEVEHINCHDTCGLVTQSSAIYIIGLSAMTTSYAWNHGGFKWTIRSSNS